VSERFATIRAVFFDAVGTLLHPEPAVGVVYAQVGRALGSRYDDATLTIRFRDAFCRQEEIDRAHSWRTDEERERRRWRNIVAEVLDDVSDREDCFRRLWDHFASPASWRVEPDTSAILEHLTGRGYSLGLASNFDARLRRLAAELPELRPLTRMAISSEIGWRKPSRHFYDAVARLAGVAPSEILIVGDDPINDDEGARAAGLAALLYDRRGDGVGSLSRLTDLLTRLS
jgi:putative hydrolase of the HAD superfamily